MRSHTVWQFARLIFLFFSVALIAACRKVHAGFQLRAPGAAAGFQVHSPFVTNFISVTLLVHCVGTGCSEPSAAGFGVGDRPGGDQHKRFPDSALGSPSPGQEVRGTASLAVFLAKYESNMLLCHLLQSKLLLPLLITEYESHKGSCAICCTFF
jgi:hypothetical protein